MRRITLRDVRAVETVPLFEGPGVILCDATNPCTDFTFHNVVNEVFEGDAEDFIAALPISVPGTLWPSKYHTDDWEFEYLTSYVYGTQTGVVQPVPCMSDDCFWQAPATSPLHSL